MLKRFRIRHKSLFALIFLSSAFAHGYLATTAPEENSDAFGLLAPAEDWSWTGKLRLQADFALDQKPSSVEGQTATEWGSLEFANRWTHDREPLEVGLAGHFGPDRDAATGQPRFDWDEARLTWTHHPRLSLGVLMDPVVAFDMMAWGETSLGREFKAGVDKWNVIPRSDLAVQLAHSTSFGLWTAQVSNGTGWPKAENGVRKDFEIVWEDSLMNEERIWKTQLFYRRGAYDQLAADRDIRERYGGQIARLSSSWNFGFVGMGLRDAVDGITGIEGDGVNLSAKGGQIVQGSLSEAWVRYVAGDSPRKWRALLRLSGLLPDESEAEKSVGSLVFGFGRGVGSGMQVDLLFQQVTYGQTHSATDRQRWFLAWAWGLERTPPKIAP